MVIYIDQREQLPYTFEIVTKPLVPFRCESAHMPTGDYGTSRLPLHWDNHGFDTWKHAAVIERKSLSDLYGTIAQHRRRLESEFERMTIYGYRAIIIEAELSAVLAPRDHLRYPTRMRPKSLLATLVAWHERYGVPIWFCPGRAVAERLTHRLLERWIRDGEQQ